MNPSEYGSHYGLGFVLAREGKLQEALPQLQRALELRPDSSEARFQLANVLKALGRKDEADRLFQDLRQTKEQSVAADMASARGRDANSVLLQAILAKQPRKIARPSSSTPATQRPGSICRSRSAISAINRASEMLLRKPCGSILP
jgi:Flp pilus assembly protein TadD